MSSTRYLQRTDSHGNTFHLGDIGGLHLPPFPSIQDFRQHARDVRELEMNPDDVIFVGFPKSGFHWVTSMVHMLMKNNTDTYFQNGLGALLDRTPITADNIPPVHTPRIFYSHLKLRYLPRQVLEKKVKLIYLQRNPKDVWVSLFNHVTGHLRELAYDGTWNHFCDLMFSGDFWYGNWFDYVLDWERDMEKAAADGVSVFINPYEDTIKDPVGQIKKLDRFLGTNRGRELCKQIADVCQFTKMKAVKDGEWKGDKFFKDTAVGYYRKGQVGDWKNWFTVAQSERFDKVFKKKMQGSKLRYTFA